MHVQPQRFHHATVKIVYVLSYIYEAWQRWWRTECLKRKAKGKIPGPWHGQGHEKITPKTPTTQVASLPDLSLEHFFLQTLSGNGACKHTWEFLEALKIICWLPTSKETRPVIFLHLFFFFYCYTDWKPLLTFTGQMLEMSVLHKFGTVDSAQGRIFLHFIYDFWMSNWTVKNLDKCMNYLRWKHNSILHISTMYLLVLIHPKFSRNKTTHCSELFKSCSLIWKFA